MQDRHIFLGLGIIVVVMIAAAFIRSGGSETVRETLATRVAPISSAVDDLGEQVTSTAGAVDELGSQVDATTGAVDGLAGRVDAVEGGFNSATDRLSALEGTLASVSDQVSEAATAGDVAALSAKIDDLSAQLAAMTAEFAALQSGSAPAVAPSASAPAAASNAGAAPAADVVSGADEDGPAGLTPGMTALYAGGDLRVFVSRLEPEADRAHVVVAGARKVMREGIGRTLPVADGFCRVTMDGVSKNGALFGAICGDDLPAAQGIQAGETKGLSDGALRVFASRVTEDTGRISVNGSMLTLDAGSSDVVLTEDQSCRVTLEQVDRGHAEVSSICTDAVTISDMLTPGMASVLGDGAVRVFMARVADDGSARFAVNGLNLVSGAAGDLIALDPSCSVRVDDVTYKAARFSHACY